MTAMPDTQPVPLSIDEAKPVSVTAREPVTPKPTALLGSGNQTCAFVREVIARSQSQRFGVAEIGVWLGDTSLELARLLPPAGFLHLFDYDDLVQPAKQRLAQEGYANVSAFGCARKWRDSYNWPLMRILNASPVPIYDYVYLDGAHDWTIDGFAFSS